MSNYRVRRDLPNNSYVQLKSAPLAECKSVLQSIKRKWDDLRDVGLDGSEPYVVELAKGGKELVVTQAERIVDRYIVEPA